MTNLFEEFDKCDTCVTYRSDVILDETSEGREITEHLIKDHNGKNKINYLKDAFVSSKRNDTREFLSELFMKIVKFLDKNFEKNFIPEFPQRCWEMQVCSYLLDQNLTLIQSSRRIGPDFETEDSYYECICIEEGKDKNQIPLMKVADISTDIQMVPVSKESVELRIGSAFMTKYEKFEEYRTKEWFNNTKRCCIAINYSANGYTFAHGQINIDNIFLNQGKFLINSNGTAVKMGYLAGSDCQIDTVVLSSRSPYFTHIRSDFVTIERLIN